MVFGKQTKGNQVQKGDLLGGSFVITEVKEG